MGYADTTASFLSESSRSRNQIEEPLLPHHWINSWLGNFPQKAGSPCSMFVNKHIHVGISDKSTIGEPFLNQILRFFGRQSRDVDVINERQVDVAVTTDTC